MYWLLFPYTTEKIRWIASNIASNIANKIKYAVYKPSLTILSRIYSFSVTCVLDEQLCNRCKSNSIYSDITNNSSDIDIDVENYFNGLPSAEHLEYMEDLYNYSLDNYNIISPNSDNYYCN